ncbi:MAG: hypothetical protein KF817_12260 [Phycisphaeraceae bacterium]|nr:hypothetical protein [Phycisphaeraceae bacterium]
MQQLVILARESGRDGALGSLGTRRELLEAVAPFNISPERPDEDVLYGPGVRIELPPGDPVTQMLLSITEEEIAWHVIIRVAKALQWRLFDPRSGRELSP